ncbi:MAG: DUF5606 domain-containing protein [Bacteroidetes bacterium]|nr:DUF5606 domain-containing protein [Bacteroidota bacterium]MBU1718226.1 DUF5606 domain-containing protein [Bacteroidota bacterium]
MDIRDYYSISGKPGLYTVVASAKASVIVESIIDGKRFPAFSTQRMMALGDISIYTKDSDIPLSDVMRMIYEKENGGLVAAAKGSNNEIITYFESVLPDYDNDRVYVSDMKKLYGWYNLLHEKGLLKLKPEESGQEEEAVAEVVETEQEQES